MTFEPSRPCPWPKCRKRSGQVPVGDAGQAGRARADVDGREVDVERDVDDVDVDVDGDDDHVNDEGRAGRIQVGVQTCFDWDGDAYGGHAGERVGNGASSSVEGSGRGAGKKGAALAHASKAGARVASDSGFGADNPAFARLTQPQPVRLTLRAHIDGSCLNHEGRRSVGHGPAGVGVYIEAADGHPAEEISFPLPGVTTNNAAEWHALLAALARAEELGAGRLDVLSDSRLVVRGACRIAKGHGYRGASERLRTLAEVAGLYISCLRGFSIAWIPREQNWRADRLARRASAESRLVGLREAKGFK